MASSPIASRCLPNSQQPKSPLLKWVGNKQRFAAEIVAHLPKDGHRIYYEPFLGAGAVLGALGPARAAASDACGPLMGIWATLRDDPLLLKEWYADRWRQAQNGDKAEQYEMIRASFNAAPNPADLLYLCRSCYCGIVRFRKADGHMSSACGPHEPISPASFAARVDEWHPRVRGTEFLHMDYGEAMRLPGPGDLVYCDPPYSHTQSIVYGAHSFSLTDLLDRIAACKDRGAAVALSLAGTKRSGAIRFEAPIPDGLFAREIAGICRRRSMLSRPQMPGRSLHSEEVTDRLLLTF